jgi:hypothetical protein
MASYLFKIELNVYFQWNTLNDNLNTTLDDLFSLNNFIEYDFNA